MSIGEDPRGSLPIGRILPRPSAAEGTCRREPHNDAVVWALQGKVTFSRLEAALERALDLGLAEFVIWNIVDGDLTELSLRELEALVTEVLNGPAAPRKWAILGAPGASLAAAAVLVAAAEDRGFGDRVEAFVDRDAAYEWLGFRELPTTPAAPDAELLRR